MGRLKTHDEYISEAFEVNPNIIVVGNYINASTKIAHKCKVCGYDWLAKPCGILWGYGCPRCSGVMKYTHSEYEKRIKKTNPNIKVLDEYINMNAKILHKCILCNHEWETKPSDVVHGHGCPICSGRIIGCPPEYKNSIWSSEYREYFSKYMTEEQMKTHMPSSNIKIEVQCPDCNRYKKISPNSLHKNGLGCICGDGISYPNKFMYSVLKQLNLEYILEYSPEWANKKQYDIYIPSLNCIIENHGAQHYMDGFKNFKKMLNDEKQNDEYKENLAKANGIRNYIVIDCRYSDKDWIKESVLNSSLPSLIEFSENDINWLECDMFATSNLVKTVANLWNNGMCADQIRNKMNLSRSTIYNYLNKGAKLMICDYTKELSKQRTKEYKNKQNKEGAN